MRSSTIPGWVCYLERADIVCISVVFFKYCTSLAKLCMKKTNFVSRISGVRRFISLPKGAVKEIVCGANKL